MGRPATGLGVLERARKDMAEARTADQLRIAQAVLLPLDPGLSLAQTAVIVGRSASWVARERRRYIEAEGQPVKSTRGGRRRALLTSEDEVALVKSGYMLSAHSFTDTARTIIRRRLEAKVGRPVADSTLDAMIKRVVRQLTPSGSVYDMRNVSRHLTEIWLRDRILAQKAAGKKLAV